MICPWTGSCSTPPTATGSPRSATCFEWSYLDVYENAEYVGSVKVRDRLRGFDLVGSTLVVLVDRQVGADDADGIPDRALDWYDLGDLPFGG